MHPPVTRTVAANSSHNRVLRTCCSCSSTWEEAGVVEEADR
jgi:hypothetical protein